MTIVCSDVNRKKLIQYALALVVGSLAIKWIVFASITSPWSIIAICIAIVAMVVGMVLIGRQRPVLILHGDGSLEAVCYRISDLTSSMIPHRKVASTQELAEVWVGCPRDYTKVDLFYGSGSRTFCMSTVLVFTIRNDDGWYMVRDIQLLSHISCFLSELRDMGVPVSVKENACIQ